MKIPKELQSKIEREAEKYSSDLDKPFKEHAEVDFEKGAQSIAVQLAKAVEALRKIIEEEKKGYISFCGLYEPRDKLEQFLESYEAWLKGDDK